MDNLFRQVHFNGVISEVVKMQVSNMFDLIVNNQLMKIVKNKKIIL